MPETCFGITYLNNGSGTSFSKEMYKGWDFGSLLDHFYNLEQEDIRNAYAQLDAEEAIR